MRVTLIMFLFICLFVQLGQAQKPYVLLKTLNNHNAPIECLKVHPDGKLAVTADHDGYIIFWSIVDSMKMLYKVKAHTGGINCLIFNKSGTKFVTAGDDYKIKLWNFNTRKPIHSYTSPYSSVNFAVLAPDEKSIYFGGYKKSSTNSFIRTANFTGLYQVATDGASDPALLYDDPSDMNTNNWGITDGNLDASRKYIVFTKGYYVYFWDIKTNTLAFKKYSETNLNNLYSTSSYIWLWGDGYISKMSVNDDYNISKTFAGVSIPALSHYSAFAFSKNGKYMLTGDDHEKVNIWNASTGTKTQVLVGHTDVVRTFSFGYSDSLIVTAGYDGTIKIWGYEEIKERIDSLEKVKKDTVVVVVRDTVMIVEDTLHTVLVKDSIHIEKDTTTTTHIEKTEVVFSENNIPVRIKDRTVELQSTVTVNQSEFDIEIYDRSVVDGDSISLNINGDWILQEYSVVKTKLKIHVKINPNASNNYLILYAHNLGEISPNTAAVQFLIGDKIYKLTLTSDLQKSGALNFVYKP